MKKIALITGVNGQDGAYLAEYLLKRNYKVIGTLKSNKSDTHKLKKLGIKKRIVLVKMDLSKFIEIKRIFNKYKIDEVYNLASQSNRDISFEKPLQTSDVNAIGVLRLLEIIRRSKKKIKYFQASSSEIFGSSKSYKQSENTKFDPLSPYAVSKLFGHFITKNYRETYKIFAVSGILFNHESPLRSENYITPKIIKGLIDIKNKNKKKLLLGNISVKRDWGYSKDYVKLMWKMIQAKTPKDYVIATGRSHSVRELINITSRELGMKTKWIGKNFNLKLINKIDNSVIISIDKKFFRKSEIKSTRGNISKVKKELSWKPMTNFNTLIKILIKDYEKQE